MRVRWNGPASEVFALLRQQVVSLADATLQAYVDAVAGGGDPVAAMLQAHFGNAVNEPMRQTATTWCTDLDRKVAWLRSLGNNLL